MSPIEQWITQWKPTDFSFTLFVFVILFTTVFILLRKIVPYLIDTKWPGDQALREKRIQAEIDAVAASAMELLLRPARKNTHAAMMSSPISIAPHSDRVGTPEEGGVAWRTS